MRRNDPPRGRFTAEGAESAEKRTHDLCGLCDLRGESFGFTMIEILIVIVVLALLASIATVAVISSMETSRTTTTQNAIQMLEAALKQYESVWRDYPPTELKGKQIRMPNDLNTGIESMLACLSSQEKGGPYYRPKEDFLTNFDGDSLPANPTNWYFGDNQLREVMDSWNNPYIYFHYRDYATPAKTIVNYTIGEKTVKCQPQKSEKTKVFHDAGRFQIWSAGPNGVNENGGGDDVPSWK